MKLENEQKNGSGRFDSGPTCPRSHGMRHTIRASHQGPLEAAQSLCRNNRGDPAPTSVRLLPIADGQDTLENNTMVVHGTYPYLVIRHGDNIVGLRRNTKK